MTLVCTDSESALKSAEGFKVLIAAAEHHLMYIDDTVVAEPDRGLTTWDCCISCFTRNASVYLAVSDFETSIDEKAWLLVRFTPVHGMGVTREMIRVEREVSANDRHDKSIFVLSYTPVRVRAVIFCWGVTPLIRISHIRVTHTCSPPC
jgi:hypothetical protein